MALVQHTFEHAQAAQQLLQAVLVLTHVQGDVRLFLDEGEALTALLALSAEHKAQNNPIHDYVEQLLAAFKGPEEHAMCGMQCDQP